MIDKVILQAFVAVLHILIITAEKYALTSTHRVENIFIFSFSFFFFFYLQVKVGFQGKYSWRVFFFFFLLPFYFFLGGVTNFFYNYRSVSSQCYACGIYVFSIIHRTLTWTTGPLTCTRDLIMPAFAHGCIALRECVKHIIFDSEKFKFIMYSWRL